MAYVETSARVCLASLELVRFVSVIRQAEAGETDRARFVADEDELPSPPVRNDSSHILATRMTKVPAGEIPFGRMESIS